jgi:aminoglycoside phosphotransferase (APT) family kinase protein
MQELTKIPEARREAVQAALSSVFGLRVVADLHPIAGGVSGALIFGFDVRGRTYVLRIEPERIALRHRQRGFACMAAASAAGAAPRVHYLDPESGVAIMDFVFRRPLSEHPGGPTGLVRALGSLVAKVQATPPFPLLGTYPEMIGNVLTGLRPSHFFAPGQLEPHAQGLARIAAALAMNEASLVSCHNDPNPRNILFDGDRLWLVDWELASRNDPLVDVAILTTELAETPELEDALLEATLDRPPSPSLRARLSVIRLLTRLYYGCIVLDSLVDRLPSVPDVGPYALTPAGFRKAVADGHLAPGTTQVAYAFGAM